MATFILMIFIMIVRFSRMCGYSLRHSKSRKNIYLFFD